jgi:protoporphyrinogen oxidase
MTQVMAHVVCIGGGPAGLTAAYELVRHQKDVLVLEADTMYVGGISRTIQADGFCFDIGGHRFFSKSEEVVALWKEILGGELLLRPRKSRIFYGGKFYPYPLDLKATLVNLGMVESILCGLSYMKAQCFPKPAPKTFEDWVTNQFGHRLFLMFFKTYTEKVWGISCKDISADWAAQRIKNLSLFSALKNALMRSLGIKSKGNKIKTLIEEFLYPRKGPGMMWEEAARQVNAKGGKVEMGRKVTALAYDAQAKQWQVTVQHADGTHTDTVTAEQVISTMPLRELVHAIKSAPDTVKQAADKLGYRDFLTVALTIVDRQKFDDNWIYIHSPDVKVGRIQNFKSWSPEMVPDNALTCYGLEYFCFEGDGLWNASDEELIALGTKELEQIGLGDPKDVRKGYVVRQPKAYPVYDQEYQHHVDTIRNWLEESCPNLQVVGRNGMHKYNNQDHSMMTAMLAVKNILAGGKPYDVWRVNQDAEYHESGEQGKSGASGERLVPKSVA